MSAKNKVIFTILLLFIPLVLGIGHRVYYHGKDSLGLVFFRKHKKNSQNNYRQGYEHTLRDSIKKAEIPENVTHDVKDAPARFIGGEEALKRYLKNEVIYPKGQSAEGSVFVKVRIDEEGYTTDIVITKSMGSAFDKEAIRVINNMPQWEPQITNYKKVKSNPIIIEVAFRKP